MYYTFDSRIRYSEIDHHRTITLPGIINYFQDCSTFQSEDIGYGVERFQTEGKAWVLSYWQVVVERYPKIGERVKVSTWATSFKGILAERNFQMVDESGQAVAYANSVWTFMDEHVNNCQYVQMALEAVEKELNVHQVRVEYKHSAVYNDSILPRVAEEDNRTVVELCDPEGHIYAVVEFTGE